MFIDIFSVKSVCGCDLVTLFDIEYRRRSRAHPQDKDLEHRRNYKIWMQKYCKSRRWQLQRESSFYAKHRKLMTGTVVITLASWQHLTLDQSYELLWHNNGCSLAVLGSHHSVDGSEIESVLIRWPILINEFKLQTNLDICPKKPTWTGHSVLDQRGICRIGTHFLDWSGLQLQFGSGQLTRFVCILIYFL